MRCWIEHIEPLSRSVCRRTAPQKHPCLNPALSSQKCRLLRERKGSLSLFAFQKIHKAISHTLAYAITCLEKDLTHNPQTSNLEKDWTFHVTVRSPCPLPHRHRCCYRANISTSISTCSLCWAVPIQEPFNGLLPAAWHRGWLSQRLLNASQQHYLSSSGVSHVHQKTASIASPVDSPIHN